MAVQEVYLKPPEGEPCGKECGDYEPRNGKSGCCRFRGYCYEAGPEFKLSIDGKLTPYHKFSNYFDKLCNNK